MNDNQQENGHDLPKVFWPPVAAYFRGVYLHFSLRLTRITQVNRAAAPELMVTAGQLRAVLCNDTRKPVRGSEVDTI